jgi:tetratricopeptide (TPR) repeat protein
MSLLLDARKKSQQTLSAQGGGTGIELSLEDHPGSASHPLDPQPDQKIEHARSTGQNLFNAKKSAPSFSRASINRNLLFALGGTVLLLGAGAGYVWYEITPKNTRPARPPQTTPSTPITQPATAVEPQPDTVATIAPAKAEPATPPQPRPAARTPKAKQFSPSRSPAPLYIEKIQSEPIDPILQDAYYAYQAGQFDRSQQLYQHALRLDARNRDALIGMAAVAQRRGADSVAAHYYLKALELDPRDPVANAGMSALTTGENGESRLKTLLNEQPDSSALHSALGNRYAEQSRWGEAQQSYFNAYKLEPKNSSLAFNLAVSLDRLGQAKLAAQYYQRALELDQKHSAGFDHAQISQRIADLTQ